MILKAVPYCLYFSIVLIGFMGISCETENDIPEGRQTFYYEETGCADPWDKGGLVSDEVLKNQVSEYLEGSLEVDYTNLRVTNDGTAEGCFACHCKTGRIVRIEADMAIQDILIENGFIRQR